MLRRAATYLVLGLVLAGCGTYRPLYGTDPGQANVVADLKSISVQEQKTRAGQLVRNEILDGVSIDHARYFLKLTITETIASVSNLSSSTAARHRLVLKAHFEMSDRSVGSVIVEGNTFSTVEYDTVKVPVADLQAVENARLQASKILGQDIRLRLAARLSSTK